MANVIKVIIAPTIVNSGGGGTISVYGTSNTTLGTSGSNANSLLFAGAGGVSVGVSNGSVVISGGAVGAFSASGGSSTYNTLNFANSNGLTFSNSNGSIVGSYTVPNTAGLISAANFSAGTTSNNLSAVTFADSNGVSFGLNGSTLTASHNALTSQSNQAFSASGGSSAFQTLNFANSNGLTFSNSNGSVVGSYTVPNTAGLISAANFSAGTMSNNLSAVTFSNANGVSFGLNGSTITGSVSQSVQTQGFVNSISLAGNTAGQTTAGTGSLVLAGGPNITLSAATAAGGMTVSVSAGAGGAGDGVNIIAAGSQTANSTGSVLFQNSNGISFGMSNSSVVTASYTVPNTAGLISAINVSAGTTSNTLTAVTFSNSNGLSFGLNGSTVTGSFSTLGGATDVSDVGSGGVIGTQTSRFAFADHVHAGVGAMAAGSNTGNTLGNTMSKHGTWVVAGTNNITVSGSTGAGVHTMWLSVPAQTNQSGAIYFQGNTAGESSSSTFDARTLNISAAGGISAGWSNGSVRISGSQSNQQITAYATSNTTQSSSGTYNASSMIFAGAGIASVGVTNGSVIVSVPSAAGSINISAGTTSNTMAAVTFSNSNGVSFGLNGSTVTAQVNPTITAFMTENTTLSSSSTYPMNSQIFRGAGEVSVGASNGSIIVSARNNLLTAFNVSAGTTSNNLQSVVFSNQGGISFGMNAGGTVTASHNGLTTQKVQYIAGANGGINFETLSMWIGNGLTFSTTGAAASEFGFIGSHNGITSQSNQQITAYATSNTTQSSSGTYNASSMIFAGAGIASVGVSNGSVVVSVPAGGGAGDGYNILAAGTQTAGLSASVLFADTGNISFGMSNSSVITASYSQTNQTGNVYFVGNTTAQSSSSSYDHRSLSIDGGGIVSAGWSNGSIRISATVPTVQINISAGTTSNNLSAVTFSNSNGYSFGLNGSTVTMKQAPISMWPLHGHTHGQSSQYWGATGQAAVTTQTTISVYVQPMPLVAPLVVDRVYLIQSYATAAGTGSYTNGYSLGLYTLNQSTLESVYTWQGGLYASQNSTTAQTYQAWAGTDSASFTTTNQGNIIAFMSGSKAMAMGNASTLTIPPGMYWMAIAVSSQTATVNVVNGISIANAASQIISFNPWGEDTASTKYPSSVHGVLSHTRSGIATSERWALNCLPSTIGVANLSSTHSAQRKSIAAYFVAN